MSTAWRHATLSSPGSAPWGQSWQHAPRERNRPQDGTQRHGPHGSEGLPETRRTGNGWQRGATGRTAHVNRSNLLHNKDAHHDPQHPRSQGNEEGFATIELLVVVIIGILAAIAIPAFLNQRESAYQAAAVEARNAAIEVEAYFVQNDTYPVAGDTDAGGVTAFENLPVST